MLHDIFHWSGMLLLAASTPLMVIGALRWTQRAPAQRCPGRRHAADLLDPRNWFVRWRCGYDLSGGVAADEGGAVVCPECGRRVASRHVVPHSHRWRLIPLGGTAFVLGSLSLGVPAVRAGRLTMAAPTLALLVFERSSGIEQPELIREELSRRQFEGRLGVFSRRAFAYAVVDDLRNDGTRNNALRAMDILSGLGVDATTALEAALRSDDYQQRQLAASILRERSTPPSADLVRVTVEGLRSDELPYDRTGLVAYVKNAKQGTTYLLRWSEAIDREVVFAGLGSDDPQQRVRCAAVAAGGGWEEQIDRVMSILIDHLADNDIPGDAAIARRAIIRFGRDARPNLEAARAGAMDHQQIQNLDRILRHWGDDVTE